MTALLAFGFDNIGYIGMVVLGVGFLIFFHELGHFLAAKAAGVRVDAFSIGMGPRLFGWKRGGTDYKLCLLPIGGYVRMHGEMPGEGDPNDPRNLNNQSVGWRFLIFSGGVIMNTIFALIAFPLVFNSGVPFPAPIVGGVSPGSPAWHAGLQDGDRIVAIDGEPVYSFDLVSMEAALAGEEGLLLRVRRGSRELDVRVFPEFRESRGLQTIGVQPQFDLNGVVRLDPGDNPARRAGLRDGDRIVEDRGRPFTEEAQADIERQLSRDPLSVFEEPRELRVRRGDETLEVVVVPEHRPGRSRLGIAMLQTKVVGLRSDDAETQSALDALGLQEGDIVLGVRVGGTSKYVTDESDVRDTLAGASDASLELLRAGPGATERGPAPRLERPIPAHFLGPLGAERFTASVAFGFDDVSGRAHVQKGLAAWKIGMRGGDRILSLAGNTIRRWSDITRTLAEAGDGPLEIRWLPRTPAGGEADRPLQAQITPEVDRMPHYGFATGARVTTETYRVAGFTGSLRAGFVTSVNTLRQLYVTLKRILGGSVSADNLGGIITISRATYDYARSGWQRFLWFLAIISLNLAFINVLPIPVLDGGHLMFLLIEKIKGSPVSVRVMTYAQVLGLAMVLALLIFVTFNDIRRLLQ